MTKKDRKLLPLIKQTTKSYILYILLTFIELDIHRPDGYIDSFPIGIVVGPAITFINMIKSSGANIKFMEELKANDIMTKTIKKGETIKGVIAISNKALGPISIKLR